MKTISKVLLGLLCLTFYNCEDILEEDISNDIVFTIYPMEDLLIESNVVDFQWNTLKGADDYRLQIFNTSQVKLVDTLISKTQVTIPLSEGDYQWRVRGENSAYQSTYSLPVYFSVNESEDLTSQQVILSSPVNNFMTNSNNFTLSWNSLSAADYYNFQLINNTLGGTIVFQQNNILTNTLTLNSAILSQDGNYTWKIKGVNGVSETVFSSRDFSLDTTLPNRPVNGLPVNNSIQTINQTINFNWSIATDSGVIQSLISYRIEISNDVNFTTILQASNISANSFQQLFNSTGEYYWRVRAIDAAGNNGPFSNAFKFTIN
jgi:hypothetical protein